MSSTQIKIAEREKRRMLKIIAEGKISHQTYREDDKFQLSSAGGLAIIY